jgi:hypothetical protein
MTSQNFQKISRKNFSKNPLSRGRVIKLWKISFPFSLNNRIIQIYSHILRASQNFLTRIGAAGR